MKHTLSQQSNDKSNWRQQLAASFTELSELRRHLNLTDSEVTALEAVTTRYPLRITPHYLSLAASRSRDDPILRQCLPSGAEMDANLGGADDPLAEERQSPVPGLVHRYPDRVLLILTNQCAVHCRHCLRKRCWSSEDESLSFTAVEKAVAYIRSDTCIREVILSGGDPLLLRDDFLHDTLDLLQQIPHVEMVRIGSRLPIVLPQRFTAEFCRLLAAAGPVWLATHFNHPREISAASAAACRQLLSAGIPVVNQTVLLKGVNDTADIISSLCTQLLKIAVKPYYLFHADPVAGAMHFRTGVQRGLAIMQELQARVSGLAQPAFAFDLADGKGKVRLSPTELCADSSGRTRVRDYHGYVTDYA